MSFHPFLLAKITESVAAQVNQTILLGVYEFVNSASTANTKQALAPPSDYPTSALDFVIIYNPNANDSIYIGDANNQLIRIPAGGTLTIDMRAPNYLNITSIYWQAPTAGDTVVVMYA